MKSHIKQEICPLTASPILQEFELDYVLYLKELCQAFTKQELIFMMKVKPEKEIFLFRRAFDRKKREMTLQFFSIKFLYSA